MKRVKTLVFTIFSKSIMGVPGSYLVPLLSSPLLSSPSILSSATLQFPIFVSTYVCFREHAPIEL